VDERISLQLEARSLQSQLPSLEHVRTRAELEREVRILLDEQQCNALPLGTMATGPNGGGLRGTSWQISLPYYANYGMYNHVSSPNSRQCSNIALDQVGLDVYGTSPATSFHPGGVNMGMADGSVRFIREQINLNPFWAIGTRAGNEPINANSF